MTEQPIITVGKPDEPVAPDTIVVQGNAAAPKTTKTEVELAELFVKYASLKDQLEFTRALIEEEVAARGTTVKIAGVTATYYKPSKEFDYKAAAEKVMEPDFDITPFQTAVTTVSTRWKEMCEQFFGADRLETEVPFTVKPARVVVK